MTRNADSIFHADTDTQVAYILQQCAESTDGGVRCDWMPRAGANEAQLTGLVDAECGRLFLTRKGREALA